jgi:hypothetical protein
MEVDLGAEPATHVGRDDRHVGVVDAVEHRQCPTDAMGVLRRAPHVQAPVDPRRRGRPHLQRAGGHPWVDQALADHDLAVAQRIGPIASGRAELAHQVGPHLREQPDLAGQGRHRIDQRRQRLILDGDDLGRVLALLGPLGEHDRHGLADEAHPVAREVGPDHGRVEPARDRRQVDVGADDHVHDAGAGAGRLDVDGQQPRVGHARPHVGSVDGTCEAAIPDVGAVGAAVGEQARILHPEHAAAEDPHQPLSRYMPSLSRASTRGPPQ